MGSAAVIFILLAVISGLAIGWNADRKESKVRHQLALNLLEQSKSWGNCSLLLEGAVSRNAQLEAEIQRLRKIPLTQPPEKVDNSVIKAGSAARVRQLTESAWGKQHEIGEQHEIE